jgi:predicted enzyme related to lactoylglutathione lyase
MKTPKPGTVSWFDLTVPNADEVKDFYSAVAGWGTMPIEMDGYSDYCMMPPRSKKPAAGICHARGVNAGLPAQWLIYITVPNLAASLKRCVAKGGKVLRPAKSMGGARMAVVRDPAGAVAALYQPPKAKAAIKNKR